MPQHYDALGRKTMMKKWKSKTREEIYRMNFEDAVEIVNNSISSIRKDSQSDEYVARALEIVLAKAQGVEPPKYHSQFAVSFILVNPETSKSHKMKAIINIEQSGAFEYGNGKVMDFNFSGSELKMNNNAVDIRYDTRYSSNDEEGYVKQYISEHWNGKNGAWKARYIKIKRKI